MTPGLAKLSARVGHVVVGAWIVGAASRASAVQIYSLYGEGCQETSGAIIGVDDDMATILTLSGELRQVKTEAVHLVARYDVLENPFARIARGHGAEAMLTVTSESSEGVFNAYPTGFFEDLVLFLDDAGKIRVVQMDEIVAIVRAPVTTVGGALAFRPIKLVSPPGRLDCTAVHSSMPGDALPVERVATLVMADKLRIDSFWAGMRRGCRDLESLRERTLFYARPVMFDQKSRLGIAGVRGNRTELLELGELPWEMLPLYLEFGGGSPYRFQSSTSIGAKSWRMIPQIRPIAAVRSEFKSHLLHGMFLANLSGFTAGKPLYTPLRNYGWDPDPDAHRHTVWMDSSFNHLTLLGLDYGSWSLSYGYYFPNFILGQKEEFREFTSTKTSSVVRLGYLPSAWQLELFVFNTDMDAEAFGAVPALDEPPQRRDEFPGDTLKLYSLKNLVDTAHVTSTSARLDLTVPLPDEISTGVDLVFTRTKYRESARSFTLEPNAGPGGSPVITLGEFGVNKIAQSRWGLRTHVRMDIGQWVALSGEAAYEHVKTDGGFAGVDAGRQAVDKLFNYTLAMELLL